MSSVATVLYHVSSSVNRDSIAEYGLDWQRMRGERGIAGSLVSEEDGVFLARDPEEADWFVRMGKDRHPSLDVWEVTLDPELETYCEELRADLPCRVIHGYLCWTEPIPPARLRVIGQGL
jgi:hypothetical protein